MKKMHLKISRAKCKESVPRGTSFVELSTEHCAFSKAAFGSWWTSFAFDYINLISPRHHHDPNKFDLFVEFILRDWSIQWKNVLFQYISYLVLHVPRQAAKISNIWWRILSYNFAFSVLSFVLLKLIARLRSLKWNVGLTKQRLLIWGPKSWFKAVQRFLLCPCFPALTFRDIQRV